MPSASRKQRINKNREKLLEYKKTLECKQCGLKDHRVIEFHHVCDKNMNVSTMLKDGYGWSRIQEEISKCIPLCCNCHRVTHQEINAQRIDQHPTRDDQLSVAQPWYQPQNPKEQTWAFRLMWPGLNALVSHQ